MGKKQHSVICNVEKGVNKTKLWRSNQSKTKKSTNLRFHGEVTLKSNCSWLLTRPLFILVITKKKKKPLK